MAGQLDSSVALNVGTEGVEVEPLGTPKSEVDASRVQVHAGGSHGALGRVGRDSLHRLLRATLPYVILAFAGGLLLGRHVPSQRLQPTTPFDGLPTPKDSGEQQPPSETHQLPPSSPKEDGDAPGVTEMHDASLLDSQLPPHDEWGLPSLSHFEQTLPPELKQGKEEVASVLRKSCAGRQELDEVVTIVEGSVALALSGQEVNTLVGMTIVLNDVEPIKPDKEGSAYVPRSFHVKSILGVRYPRVLMEVEDQETGVLYSMGIRVVACQTRKSPEEELGYLESAYAWARSEEAVVRQASCGTPAHKVAEQKGLAVPLYVGNIAKLPSATFMNGLYIFNHVQITERVYGGFNFGSLVRAGLSLNAKEYIANRLLKIVLKLQQALLSHNDINWENIDARADGSFVLGGFDACTPFGKAIGRWIKLSGKSVEPTLRIQEDANAFDAAPQANSDLWSLGLLFYELFTDGSLPYTQDEKSYTEDAVGMAKYILDTNVDPGELVRHLDEAKCPSRWKQLILKLLNPVRGFRTTAWDIMTDFPDLVGHRLPR